MTETKPTELPPLIDLPVYREIYLNQARTDELCKLIWQEKPEYVKELMDREMLPFPQNRDAMFSRIMGDIIRFFRAKEKEERIQPISIIGMVDLTYEIDRRVRKVMRLEGIEPIGEPISSGPEGPFPRIEEIDNYIWGKRDNPPLDVSPERKEIYDQLYKSHPEIIFAYAELNRRWLRTGEPDWFISNYFKENLPRQTPKFER